MLKKKIAAVLTALAACITWMLPAPALASAEFVPQETSCRTLTDRINAQQADRNIVSGAAGRPYTKQYYYEQLDGPSKAVYNAILSSALSQGPSTERIKIDLSALPARERTIIASFQVRMGADGSEDAVNSPECSQFCSETVDPALAAIMFDHSELSWLRNTEYGCALNWNGQVTYNMSGMRPGETRVFTNYTLVLTGMEFEITPTGYAWATMSCDGQNGPDKYNYANTEDLARIQQALDIAVAQIGDLSVLAVPDQIQTIHDWVCMHVDYADKSGARFLNDWRGYQTAYSALVDGETVCAGYCAAFKLLCDAYDIPCVIVRGLDGERGAHVWNYVQVEGQWYGVDCTWDDEGQTAVHDFFLRGSDSFLAAGTPGYHEERLLYDPYPFAYPVLARADYARASVQSAPSAPAAPVPTQTQQPSVLAAGAAPGTASSNDPAFWPPLRAAKNGQISFTLQDTTDGTYLAGLTAWNAPDPEQLVGSMEGPEGMTLRLVNQDGTGAAADIPVCTGQRIEVLNEDGAAAWSAEIVVSGDVIGSGRLTLAQLVQMGRQLTRGYVLSGPYLAAADVTGDGNFSISDLVMEADALANKWA